MARLATSRPTKQDKALCRLGTVPCLALLILLLLPNAAARGATDLTATLNDQGIRFDPEGTPLFVATNLAPGKSVERLLAIRNAGSGPYRCSLQVVALDGITLLQALTIDVRNASGTAILYQGSLTGGEIPLGNIAPTGERVLSLTVSLPQNAGNTLKGQKAHADFVFISRGTGGGGPGEHGGDKGRDEGDEPLTPPEQQLPQEPLIVPPETPAASRPPQTEQVTATFGGGGMPNTGDHYLPYLMAGATLVLGTLLWSRRLNPQ
ncbi:MAG: hypothetical protein ACOYU7_04545 [Bacillota bacterium]|uniref:hypothetical protein n=1 Tax=Desulforudis sp. DRI-14 TaxID=3459793 RepID=UPI0034814C07